MPGNQYVSGHHPPSFTDRLLAHTFITALSVGSLVIGILLVISGITGMIVSRSLDGIPGIVTVILGGAFVAGAPVSVAGALRANPRWSKLDCMKIERSGSASLAAGWIGYALSIALSGNPYGIIAVTMGASVGSACGIWALALWLSERRTRGLMEVRRAVEGE